MQLNPSQSVSPGRKDEDFVRYTTKAGITRAIPKNWTLSEEGLLVKLREEGNADFGEIAAKLGCLKDAVQREYYLMRPKGQKNPKMNIGEGDDDDVVGRQEKLEMHPLERIDRVPCPNEERGCAFVTDTYQKANRHASKDRKHNQTEGPYLYPWSKLCASFETTNARKNHYKSHNYVEARGDYPCRRDCGTRWPTLYLLTTHEESCGRQLRPKGTQRTEQVLQFDLRGVRQ